MTENKIVGPNIDGKPAKVWVVCKKCNDAWHSVLPGEKTPYWWCQDEAVYLAEGQEIEVKYDE